MLLKNKNDSSHVSPVTFFLFHATKHIIIYFPLSLTLSVIVHKNLLALCGSFPSSGVLRIRLILSLIILRHCIVTPDSFETLFVDENGVHETAADDTDKSLTWGQPLGLFDLEDWEESYNHILELKWLLKREDNTTLYPITRIQIRRQRIINDTHDNKIFSDHEQYGMAAPTWIIPRDLVISEEQDPSSSGNPSLWTESLDVEFQDLLLSIRLMQALSIYIRQYVYDNDEEKVEASLLEKYLYVYFDFIPCMFFFRLLQLKFKMFVMVPQKQLCHK